MGRIITNPDETIQNNILTTKLLIMGQQEVLLDTGAGYNLIDFPTSKRLHTQIQELPEKVFLRTISKWKTIPIVVKTSEQYIQENRTVTLEFFVTKYNFPCIIIGRNT